eukprot:1192504-Prorocentrum_minimum.AAC.3
MRTTLSLHLTYSPGTTLVIRPLATFPRVRLFSPLPNGCPKTGARGCKLEPFVRPLERFTAEELLAPIARPDLDYGRICVRPGGAPRPLQHPDRRPQALPHPTRVGGRGGVGALARHRHLLRGRTGGGRAARGGGRGPPGPRGGGAGPPGPRNGPRPRGRRDLRCGHRLRLVVTHTTSLTVSHPTPPGETLRVVGEMYARVKCSLSASRAPLSTRGR